jgi:DNA-binding NarL/FixJ family response regulator
MSRTRILLADDHTLVRSGLRMILDAAADLEVVAEAADGVEAVERGLREDVDLAVLDVAMPGRTGLHAARELTRQRPDLRPLMLSMHDELYCLQALKAGACGYVLKSAVERDLVEACRAAMRGETFLYPPTVRALLQAWLDDPTRAPASELTAREEEAATCRRPETAACGAGHQSPSSIPYRRATASAASAQAAMKRSSSTSSGVRPNVRRSE